MQKRVHIQSLDDLLAFSGKVLEGEAQWDEVDLETLSVVVPVIVKGDSWSGKVDVRGAVLIQDLQKAASSAYFDASGERLPRAVRVKAKPSQGSNNLEVDYTEIIKTAIMNMPAEYIFAFLCFGALCATGCYWYKRRTETKVELSRDATISKALDNMKEVSIARINEGVDPSRPIRRYVKTLTKEDSISVAGSDYMPKKVILEKLDKPQRDDVLMFTHCDGMYTLGSIDITEELPVLQLVQDGAKGKAQFFNRVPPAVKERITKNVNENMDSKNKTEMLLQVDAYFTNAGLKYCVVLGIGEPRAKLKHYPLADVPSDVPMRDAKIPGLD